MFYVPEGGILYARDTSTSFLIYWLSEIDSAGKGVLCVIQLILVMYKLKIKRYVSKLEKQNMTLKAACF